MICLSLENYTLFTVIVNTNRIINKCYEKFLALLLFLIHLYYAGNASVTSFYTFVWISSKFVNLIFSVIIKYNFYDTFQIFNNPNFSEVVINPPGIFLIQQIDLIAKKL